MKLQTTAALLLLSTVFCFLESTAQNGLFLGSSEEDQANSIFYFKGSNYLCGTTRADSHSPTNYYVLEIGDSGELKNEFAFGGVHRDVGKWIRVNEDGIYVFGKTWDGGFPNNDMLLTKLDFSGKQIWKKYYGGTHNDLGHKFIETSDGGFAMAGFNRSVDDFGNAYLVKADKNGELIWDANFGEKYVDHAFDVVENTQRELLIAGTKGGFFNPTSTDFLNPDAEIFIVKTSATGEKIWEKTFGGDGHDWAKRIINAPGGGYYLCGSTQSAGAGSFDLFLIKIDEDGNQLWKKTFGGSEFEYGESVELTADNKLLLYGTTASFSDNKKPDHFLVKTDLDGNMLWQKTYGGTGSDYGTAMIATADSGCAITGWTMNGTIGKKDIVFYKIAPNGDALVISSIPADKDSISLIKVYPNPVKKNLKVKIESNFNGTFDLMVYNLNGAKVFQSSVNSNALNNVMLPLTSGVYVLTILDEADQIFEEKIIVD